MVAPSTTEAPAGAARGSALPEEVGVAAAPAATPLVAAAAVAAPELEIQAPPAVPAVSAAPQTLSATEVVAV
jgi:hypothetical protein